MRGRSSGWRWLVTALLGGVTLYNAIATGSCARFTTNQSLVAFDWCWLLDCTNGIGGGAIPLCDPNNPLLTDCQPTGGGTGGTTNTQQTSGTTTNQQTNTTTGT